MSDSERKIQERAHELWEQEGRPHGRHEEHWEQARREIEDGGSATKKSARPKAVKSSAAAARTKGAKAAPADEKSAAEKPRAAKPAAAKKPAPAQSRARKSEG